MINQLSQELSHEEARYHAMLPKHAQDVLKGKKILLWKRLLEMTQFPDIDVVDLMKGVSLVGVPKKIPVVCKQAVPCNHHGRSSAESFEVEKSDHPVPQHPSRRTRVVRDLVGYHTGGGRKRLPHWSFQQRRKKFGSTYRVVSLYAVVVS